MRRSLAAYVLGTLVLLVGAFSLRGQHVSVKTNYYAVTGSGLREIHQSLRASRPWRATGSHDGFTVWNVSWRYNTTHNGAVCRLAGFSTTVTINVTLPRWVASTNAAEMVKAEWDRYVRALGQHEYGHAQLALAAAAEIQKSARQLPDEPSCEGLKQRVNSVCEGIIQKYRALDVAYDQRTDHGRNDGARLGRGERRQLAPE